MSGRIGFMMGFKTQKAAPNNGSDTGFRVYIFGDFSGHPNAAWDQHKIRRIDIDNFEQVMTEIMPTLELGSGASLQFGTLEDFHPDLLLKRVPILADLLSLKMELANPATAEQAAAKIRAFLPSETRSDISVPRKEESTESQEDMLERLLGRRPERLIGGTDLLDRFIQQAVSPHINRDIAPQHQELINVIETTIGQFLRALLHSPDFQALESLWRATEGLVNEEVETDQQFYLVDISRAELLAECRKGDRAFEQKLLQHIQSGDQPQDVLFIGDYGFSDSAEDSELLAFCSDLAKDAGGCFLARADQALIQNLQNWRQHLGGICADSVVLSYPRYLLRLPYGTKRDPIEALAFEECSAIPRSEDLLWGNPAFLCAEVLIRSQQGQNPEQSGFFSDVPVFAFDQDGEQILQPATESMLNESQANALTAEGITPLIGFRQRQGIRVMPIVTLSG